MDNFLCAVGSIGRLSEVTCIRKLCWFYYVPSCLLACPVPPGIFCRRPPWILLPLLWVHCPLELRHCDNTQAWPHASPSAFCTIWGGYPIWELCSLSGPHAARASTKGQDEAGSGPRHIVTYWWPLKYLPWRNSFLASSDQTWIFVWMEEQVSLDAGFIFHLVFAVVSECRG